MENKLSLVSYLKGRTQKTVMFKVYGTIEDDEILKQAMDHADETKSSLFGWNFDRNGKFVTVVLFTD